MLCTGTGKRSEEFSSSLSCSSRQKVSARRIVVKRQVTVATLMVSSSVVLGSCVADIGTRSASEETTNVDETGGISSADGAGEPTGTWGMTRTAIGGNRHAPTARKMCKAPANRGRPAPRGRENHPVSYRHWGNLMPLIRALNFSIRVQRSLVTR